MENENTGLNGNALEDTIPNEAVISVKFNKKEKQIPMSQAVTLIQKGMKFDMCSDELLCLKALAAEEECSVGDYLARLKAENAQRKYDEILKLCGGNEDAAKELSRLRGEMPPQRTDISEITEHFPNIKSKDDLPEAVLEKHELSGGNLLDIYLRYLLREHRLKEKIKTQSNRTAATVIGSLSKNEILQRDSAAREFLKGIRGR